MASLKDTHVYNGIFSKLKVVVAFLKFAEIAMTSIQLTFIQKLLRFTSSRWRIATSCYNSLHGKKCICYR
jgi:hypothetical protein